MARGYCKFGKDCTCETIQKCQYWTPRTNTKKKAAKSRKQSRN